ncbi:hypothetical protein ACFP7A_03890 [Sporolactobacillus kofuensis]|uniref:Uncharacterized protein n=1 Tax=Sporolactobacillus kofuensis TaxID=269672 RepID=A0ABW1WDJ5_9BACL|nr:hypothetical protein [Sporolactobacillus kofuensis]MCO7175014.1 hypothetical protein [Sporolactobacillus kofuensis]
MTKNKKIVFVVLILALAGVLISRYLLSDESYKTFRRNTKSNTAQMITLRSGNTYTVDNKRFKPGYYDIKATSGHVTVGIIHLKKGDRIVNRLYTMNNKVQVSGKGAALLTPSKFKKIIVQNKRFELLNETGNFRAGQEIESGTYKLSVENNKNTPFELFVQVVDAKTFQEKNSDDIKKNRDTFEFKLKKGEDLQLTNFSKKDTDLVIELIKMK